MKKGLLILLVLFVVCSLEVACFAQQGVVEMKKIVLIIPEKEFRDEELMQPKAFLEKNGIEVKVASTTLNSVTGMLGARVKPDILVSDIKVEDFDAIVFIGGSGSGQYWDDPLAHQIAQDAVNSGRIVAAICIAPVTLARAGILKEKRATVFSSEASLLTAQGAKYSGKAVEKDGNIITASGPSAAREFAEELVKALK